MRLLVTRPEPDVQRTAAALRARGHEVLVAPLLVIEFTNADFGPPRWDGIVMTSASAARALSSHPRLNELLPLPVLAVGERTAEAARRVGFTVMSADGNAADLIGMVARRFSPPARLLYPAGADRACHLAAALGRHGIEVTSVELYRARALTRLPAEAEASLRAHAIEAVLHFSRRSAETFLGCAERSGLLEPALAARHFCISERAARPLRDRGALTEVAARPQEDALLRLLQDR
jgi:uroporphyrinogen-III synthase